jgi:hypothetical protein
LTNSLAITPPAPRMVIMCDLLSRKKSAGAFYSLRLKL